MESAQLLTNERRQGTTSFAKGLGVVVVLLGVATLSMVLIMGSVLLYRVENHTHPLPGTDPLPHRFVLPGTHMTPAKDQGPRGTCWIFSTMGILEASYRKHGFEKGWLKEDEYVAFSEQAYGIGLAGYCQKHPEDKYCFAGPAANTTEDGEPEWLYYLRDHVTQFVLPSESCPYIAEEGHAAEFTCNDFNAKVAASPISFKVKDIRSAYTPDAIKRLLLDAQVPLTWSHSVYETTYEVPCDDPRSFTSGSEQCQKCLHPCSKSATGCCAFLQEPGWTDQGVFALYDTPLAVGGHAMTLVGWNDQFRIDTGITGFRGHHTTGGFIIKNSWSNDVAHSAGYWAQDHSVMDENFICPCEASSVTWLPAKAQCMAEKADPVKCAPGTSRVVFKKVVSGATVLECNPRYAGDFGNSSLKGWTGCKAGMHYVLASTESRPSDPWITVPALSNGYAIFHLAEWDPKNPAAGATIVETNATTWRSMEALLKPVALNGNTEHCGFYFMPYETLLEGTAVVPPGGHDTPSVSFIEIEWDDSSFLNSGKRKKGADYSYLEKSTKKYKIPSFKGPFDFDVKA